LTKEERFVEFLRKRYKKVKPLLGKIDNGEEETKASLLSRIGDWERSRGLSK